MLLSESGMCQECAPRMLELSYNKAYLVSYCLLWLLGKKRKRKGQKKKKEEEEEEEDTERKQENVHGKEKVVGMAAEVEIREEREVCVCGGGTERKDKSTYLGLRSTFTQIHKKKEGVTKRKATSSSGRVVYRSAN